MVKKNPSKAELETELRILRQQRRAGNVASVINNAIRWTGCGVIAYFLFKAIDSLSGQTTTADIGIGLVGQLELSDVFAILFGGGGAVYGARQKSLRQETVERLQLRIRELEENEDGSRTSSGLTPRGETNPEDI
ncbi:hypothetical protein [Novipirellula maiorica]|uniref:hypothetical protein n=1 Tax=Novipirellula maiorica TaxID=1265734 RepID=UPI001181B75A|nr:hypothetical protein [Rhodopirellula maiorica]